MGIRQTVRDRITKTLLSDNIEAMEQAIRVMETAYRRGPVLMDEQQLITALTEADSYLIDYVMRNRNWQLLSQSVAEYSETDRIRAVDEARHSYMQDVHIESAVNFWTDFGFGQTVEVVLDNDALAQVWNEFWTARRNSPILGQRKINKLSNSVINDGETFLVFFTSAVGKGATTTVRRLDTKAVSKIVCEADDPDIPLYYVRQKQDLGEIWYPDWRATDEQLAQVVLPSQAELVTDLSQPVVTDGEEVPVTKIKVLHVAYDEHDGRGWPMFTRVYSWSRVLRDFLGDRAAVSRRVAMYVDRIQHKGGSRAQDAIQATFQSALDSNTYSDTNPPAPAGSTAIHNEVVEWNRQSLTTGAGDALSDWQILSSPISVGTKIPAHWRGNPQALANRATAREMARPTVEALQRYQNFWADVFRDMVEIVGMNAGGFEDYSSKVTLDVPIDTDMNELATGMDAVSGALTSGAVDEELAVAANNAMVKLQMAVLNVPNALDVVEAGEREPTPEEIMLAGVAKRLRKGEITEVQAAAFLLEEGLLVL